MTEIEELNEYNVKHYDGFCDDEVQFEFEKEDFEEWIQKQKGQRGKMTIRTINSVLKSVQSYFAGGRLLTLEEVNTFKQTHLDNGLSPATVNRYLMSLRVYLRFLSEKYKNERVKHFPIRAVKIQHKQFIDNVISRADYDFLVNESRKDLKNPNVYLAIRIMGTTGVRRCELYQVKVEHLKHGCFDVIGKGGKQRRIYFPKTAREEILGYLEKLGVSSGYIIRRWKTNCESKYFTENTREGGKIEEILKMDRLLSLQLQSAGKKYGIAPELMHAHGFRHFFAKEFLKHRLDISLLADLLGHNSLEITRIYLKMTSREQADVVNEVVDW